MLYLFLSLMLSYLGCEDEECEFRLITYLEKQPPVKRSCPFNWMCGEELPKGREFLRYAVLPCRFCHQVRALPIQLIVIVFVECIHVQHSVLCLDRYCKFGTLQYCVVRPTTTLIAMLLDLAGVYHESELSLHYGYVYILFIMNVSIGYAFIVLASFYTAMKYKLKPYEPVGKFLCIKFVIFFAFWQSVVITGFVKIGWITGMGAYSAREVATGAQDFLICIEMFIAAVAFTYTFSYIPFTEGYVNTKELNMLAAEHDVENTAAMEYFLNATDNDIKADGRGGSGAKKGSKSSRKSGVGLLNMLRSTRKPGFPFPSGGAPAEQKTSTTPTGKGRADKGKGKQAGGHVKQGNYHLIEMSDEVVARNNSGASAGTGAEDVHNTLHPTTGSSSANSAHTSNTHSGTYSTHSVHSTIQSRSIYSAHSYQPPHNRPQPPPTIAGELLDKHFSASTAIRDFNQTMPVVVLPSGFEMHRGVVVNSDPETRLRALQEEDQQEHS